MKSGRTIPIVSVYPAKWFFAPANDPFVTAAVLQEIVTACDRHLPGPVRSSAFALDGHRLALGHDFRCTMTPHVCERLLFVENSHAENCDRCVCAPDKLGR